MGTLPAEIASLFTTYGGVVDTSTAKRAGLNESRLREMARSGKIYRLGHGIYTRRDVRELSEWDRFTLRARAFARVHAPSALLTGWAASTLWQFPTLGRPPELPTAVRPVGHGGPFISARGRMTEAHVPREHRRTVGSFSLVGKAWATVDVARAAPLPHSLVVADQAARAGVDLAAVLHHMRGWPGVERARWVVAHADPLAETPLETLGRFAFIEYDLPMPVANAWVGHDRPRKRLDGLLPWHRIALEGDGARQGRLRLDFVRYTWSDVFPSRLPFVQKVREVIAERPAGDEPIRWWKHVPGGDPVEPGAHDWPSREPRRILLPAGWDVDLHTRAGER